MKQKEMTLRTKQAMAASLKKMACKAIPKDYGKGHYHGL